MASKTSIEPIGNGKFSIDAFKSGIAKQRDFARSFFYHCAFFPLTNTPTELKSLLTPEGVLLAKSVALPASITQTVELKYFTRSVKIAGAREVQPITITFFNTSDYNLRHFLLLWQQAVSTSRESNTREQPISAHSGLYMTIILDHFDITMDSPPPKKNPDTYKVLPPGWGRHRHIGRYELYNAFPSSVGSPVFAYDNEEVQTFDVTFEYLDLEFTPIQQISGEVLLVAQEAAEALVNPPPYSPRME